MMIVTDARRYWTVYDGVGIICHLSERLCVLIPPLRCVVADVSFPLFSDA